MSTVYDAGLAGKKITAYIELHQNCLIEANQITIGISMFS